MVKKKKKKKDTQYRTKDQRKEEVKNVMRY